MLQQQQYGDVVMLGFEEGGAKLRWCLDRDTAQSLDAARRRHGEEIPLFRGCQQHSPPMRASAYL